MLIAGALNFRLVSFVGQSIYGLITVAIKYLNAGAALAPPNWGAASSAPTAGVVVFKLPK
jgi:hypothetical protein